MNFDKIEDLSLNQIATLFEDIIQEDDFLSCQCACNGVYRGELQSGCGCGGYNDFCSCCQRCRNHCGSGYYCRQGYLAGWYDGAVCYR